MKRGILAPMVMAVLGFALGGTALAAGPSEESLAIGVDADAVGIDPHVVTAYSSMRRIDLLYNRLVRFNESLDVVPDLALSWDIPDNLTYVFHLRKGVSFHGGREMTAEDVQYSLNRVLSPKTASPGRAYISSVAAVEVLDRYTVRIRLSTPLASLLEGLSSNNCSIVAKEVVEANGGSLQHADGGTGPFMLKEWTAGESMTLARNPGYFEKGFPLLDKVVFRVIPEQDSRLAAVKSGELQAAMITDGAIVRRAMGDPTVIVQSGPGTNIRMLSFNCARKPFYDARVRQAIACALDREKILVGAEAGLGAVTGPVPVASRQWALPVERLPFASPDLARAKKLLAEAGYGGGLEFALTCSPTYDGGLAAAELIRDELARIGVKVRLDVVETSAYIDKWVRRDYEAMVELRGGSGDPDRVLYRTYFSSSNTNSLMFKDPEVDRLLLLGRTQTARGDRKATYDRLQTLIVEAAPAVFLYCPNECLVLGPKVRGFKIMATGNLAYLAYTRLAP